MTTSQTKRRRELMRWTIFEIVVLTGCGLVLLKIAEDATVLMGILTLIGVAHRAMVRVVELTRPSGSMVLLFGGLAIAIAILVGAIVMMTGGFVLYTVIAWAVALSLAVTMVYLTVEGWGTRLGIVENPAERLDCS